MAPESKTPTYPKGSRFAVAPERRPAPRSGSFESETGFQAWVVGCGLTFGWKVYHTHDSRHSEEGFPDLVMLRGERMIVAELKVGGKVPTRAQVDWLLAFSRVAGSECYLWDETDRDVIERTLA